jgi:uncharacterized membrane protein
MNEIVKHTAERCSAILEILGVGIITALSLYALGYALFRLVQGTNIGTIFEKTRNRLIRGVLLGLEFLVAADIINTVAVELSLHSVAVLSIIVAIRTFLSFTLEVEMTGKWPWQQKPDSGREEKTGRPDADHSQAIDHPAGHIRDGESGGKQKI